ncbi:MAG: hypothetical protein J6Q52_03655 [Clostridia bacterium]|nr:hypothetical protein [Clostridia bacterium]
MANNKKGVLSTIVGAVIAVVTFVLVVAKFVMNKLVKGIVFFGLEIPLIYILYGALLKAIFGFDVGAGDINATLYTWGFYVSIALAVVVTIRHIITPDQAKVRYVAKHTQEDKPKKKGWSIFKKPTPQATASVPTQYSPAPRYVEPPRVRTQPLVYRSKVNPELLIYEYPDRYDVYRDGRLHAIEYK